MIELSSGIKYIPLNEQHEQEMNTTTLITNNNINNNNNNNNISSSTNNKMNTDEIKFSDNHTLDGTRRSKFTAIRVLFVLALIFIGLTCALILILIVHINSMKNELHYKSNQNLCLTEKCLSLSLKIYQSLNTSIDPCEDFYEYSCGGWIEKNQIPAAMNRWGVLNSITYSNQVTLRQTLEDLSNLNNLTQSEIKAIHLYHSCIDPEGITEHLGAKPFLDFTKHIALKNNQSKRLEFKMNFKELISFVHFELDASPFFGIDVRDDDKNSSFNDIQIFQGEVALERSYYLNKTEKNKNIIESLKSVYRNVTTLIYGPIENIEEIIDNQLIFETKLAEISEPDDYEDYDRSYGRETLANLTEYHAPFLNWTEFLNEFLVLYDSPEKLTQEDTVIVFSKDYFSKLTELINEYNSTESGRFTLNFFVYFHAMKLSLPLLSSDFRYQLSILTNLLGIGNTERWRQCIELVDDIFGFGHAVGRLFVRKTFQNSKQNVLELISRIKKSLKNSFTQLSWMDDETTNVASEKVDHVTELIGYPDFIMNDTELNKMYESIDINLNDLFGNVIKVKKYSLKNEIISYRKPVRKTDWSMTPSAVNAYYAPTRNQIVFPSGILQEPFYHRDYPASINFGGIGTIIAHELSHGFDDTGRDYDKTGTLKQWWNNKTIERFKNASECMINQYSNYELDGEKVNGKRTLGENIADNGALRTSFMAYLDWIKEHGEEKELPLVNMNHRQLYFVSFAQAWCNKNKPEAIHLIVPSDSHSPQRFRVIGSISNSKEFAQVFNCKKNTQMNPEKKCKIL